MQSNLTMYAGTASQPSTEDYAEVRWVSPSDNRFRYMLSAAYYAYDYRIEVFSNWGAREYDLTHPDGTPISPLRNIVIGQGMTNVGAAFGLQYDLSDRTTLSFEGRFQNDENCGEDAQVEGKLCQEADSFAPRLAFNTAITDNHNVYGQISRGTNPGGVNLAYIDPNIVYSLQVARGDIPVPYDVGAVNEGVTYNGEGGNPPPLVDYMADDWKYYVEEELTNFEIGAKGVYGSGQGRYEVALFYMDWNDVLDRRTLDWYDDTVGGWNEGGWNDYTDAHTYLNEGDAVVTGLELSTNFNINDVWSIGGNLTWLDATYDDYCAPQATEYFTTDTAPLTTVVPILTRDDDGVLVACGVVDGNKVPRIADLGGLLRVAADLPNEIFGFRPRFNASVLYEGSHYDDPLNLIKRKAVTTVNLAAMMDNEDLGLTLRFYVNNLTDEEEPRNLGWGSFFIDDADPTLRPSAVPSWSVLPRRPREYGLTAIYRFGDN
jgi:iron complex outermembrane receptor protein